MSKIRNLLYAFLIVILLVFLWVQWSPSGPEITGVVPADIADSISERVSHQYDDVVVNANTVQPREGSNAVSVQYVVVLTIDPDILSGQVMDQSDLDKQRAAVQTFIGSVSDLLKLSQQHLLPNPTVTYIRITIISLDGQILDGVVSSKDLAAIPKHANPEEWLSVLSLSASIPVPQVVWESILSDPDNRRLIDEAFKEE